MDVGTNRPRPSSLSSSSNALNGEWNRGRGRARAILAIIRNWYDKPADQVRISARAVPVSFEVDPELGSHFKVTYDSGEIAEVSWSFVRVLPPGK